MMRRVATWGGVALMGTLLMGQAPAPPMPAPPMPAPPILAGPRSMPPLPVPPVERGSMPPFFARMTLSSDRGMTGLFEQCVDPAALARSARARDKARLADAPPPLTGCASTHQLTPGGLFHSEMTCDNAKGAKASFRMVTDGTPGDFRTHTERYEPDLGGRKTMVMDSRFVRLGACPADLKPGQMRRPDGTILETGEASRVLGAARGGIQ